MDSSTDLMYSLPDLLWSNVLKHVSSQDTLNVCREYPHISNAVHPYTAQLLFGKVVHFLTCWENPLNTARALLNLSDLQSCRLVCKNWCSEIDLMAQTHDHKLVDPTQSWESDLKRFNLLNDKCSTYSFVIAFDCLSDFAKFTQQFETLAGNRNPFPSRSFKLDLVSRGNWDSEKEELILRRENPEAVIAQYWTLLINFLQKFGKHIRNFTLSTGIYCVNDLNLNGTIQLKNLAKCLRLLPNLQAFDFTILGSKWIFNSLTELESTMASEFVDMPKLEIFYFYFPYHKPQLYNSFLNLFSQSIKRLFLPHSLGTTCKPPTMPALLVIDVNMIFPKETEYVNLLAKVAPNLRKVTIEVFDEKKPDVIQALENFPNRENFKLESDRNDELSLTLQTDN